MPKNLVIMLSAGGLALGVAACGGSSSSSSSAAPATSSAAATSSTAAAATTASSAAAPSSGPVSKLAIAANPEGVLKFSKKSLTAKAGEVAIAFTNKSPVGHNFTIESPSGATVAATPTFNGATKTVTATLKAGTYTFLCTVPGHAMSGMKGTLTVT